MQVSKIPTKNLIFKEANMLLQRFENGMKNLENCADYGSDYSVYTGTTGVVALYWLFAQFNEEDFFDSNKIDGKIFIEKKCEKQQVRDKVEIILMRI